jgi:hypothetical protein
LRKNNDRHLKRAIIDRGNEKEIRVTQRKDAVNFEAGTGVTASVTNSRVSGFIARS